MTSAKYVTDIKDFSREFLVKSPIDSGSYTDPTGRKGIYNTVQLMYKHLAPGGRYEGPLLVQGDLVTLDRGLSQPRTFDDPDAPEPIDGAEKAQRAGKHSVCIPLSGPAGEAIQHLFDEVQEWAIDFLIDNKKDLGNFGKTKCGSSEVLRAVLKQPYTSYEGRPNVRYLDLFEFDRYDEKTKKPIAHIISTKFKMPTGRGDETIDIPLACLYNKCVDIVPTFWGRRFFIGGKQSIQWFLDSAIVIDIREIPQPVAHSAAVLKYATNPDAIARLRSALLLSGGDSGGVTDSSGGDAHSNAPSSVQPAARRRASDIPDADAPSWATSPPPPPPASVKSVEVKKAVVDDSKSDDDDSVHSQSDVDEETPAQSPPAPVVIEAVPVDDGDKHPRVVRRRRAVE